MKNNRNFLKQTLKGYKKFTPKIKKRLEQMGITVCRNGKHIILEYECNDGTKAHSPLSNTGSDPRGGLNLACEISRKIKENKNA